MRKPRTASVKIGVPARTNSQTSDGIQYFSTNIKNNLTMQLTKVSEMITMYFNL